MIVGTGRVALQLNAHSLKAKRSVVRKIIERTAHRFNVSIAEVGSLDTHHRAELGFSVVSNEGAHADSMVSAIFEYIEGLGVAPVSERRSERVHIGTPAVDERGALGRWAEFGGES